MQFVDLRNIHPHAWIRPRLLVLFTSQSLDTKIIAELRNMHPKLDIMGTSSYHSVLLPSGFHRGCFGFLLNEDECYIGESRLIDLSQRQDVKAAILEGLQNWSLDKDGLSERHFILHATPGLEERCLEAFEECFGPEIEIFGATAGNDKYLDQPFVFKNQDISFRGLLVIEGINRYHQSRVAIGGYLPTLHSGIVTKAHGRTVYEIDHKPAADIINLWTEHRFESYIRRGGYLPSTLALYPLGRVLDNEPQCGFWLAHVYSSIKAQGAIQTYAEIPVNTRVTMMRGSERMLIQRIRTVIEEAIKDIDPIHIHGAVINYCAGCASNIIDQMDLVCEEAKQALGSRPFIGLCSLGEQGRLSRAERNHHGNMMVAIYLFISSF